MNLRATRVQRVGITISNWVFLMSFFFVIMCENLASKRTLVSELNKVSFFKISVSRNMLLESTLYGITVFFVTIFMCITNGPTGRYTLMTPFANLTSYADTRWKRIPNVNIPYAITNILR